MEFVIFGGWVYFFIVEQLRYGAIIIRFSAWFLNSTICIMLLFKYDSNDPEGLEYSVA